MVWALSILLELKGIALFMDVLWLTHFGLLFEPFLLESK